MLSAGNDIVSLDLTDKQRSNDSRFYLKILNESEEMMWRRSLLPHLSFENFLWLCWSVKESAYKFIKRSDPGLVFSPVKISVNEVAVPAKQAHQRFQNNYWEDYASAEEDYTGRVTVAGHTLYFRSKISGNVIATVVSENNHFKNVFWGIGRIGSSIADEQSKEIRTFVLQRLQKLFPGKEISIPKTSGNYPVIMDGADELPLPLSFAHHGNMIAYSLNLPS